MVKVRNMTSDKNNTIANQFIIETEDGEYFQSYKSIIAFIPKSYFLGCNKAYNKIQLDSYYWNYSKTTSKYRNQFLGETTKETKAKIASGEYILTDLN